MRDHVRFVPEKERLTMSSENVENIGRDPFRKTPWLGRILIAALEKLIAVGFAIAFKNTVFPDTANSFAFALAVISTIIAIIFVGRIGMMVPGRGKLRLMVALTYVMVLANRIAPKFWHVSYMSVEVLSFASLLGLAVLQVPNIFRAVELKHGEDEVYRKRFLDDPSRFHRSAFEEAYFQEDEPSSKDQSSTEKSPRVWRIAKP